MAVAPGVPFVAPDAPLVAPGAPEPWVAPPFTCSGCGAEIPSPPEVRSLQASCHYCGRVQPVPDVAARQNAMHEAERRAMNAQRHVQDEAREAANRSAGTRKALLGWLAGGVSVVLFLAAMWPVLRMTGLFPSYWSGAEPFECSGNDNTRISGATARLHGTAVIAADNCRLTITDCDIRADIAIEASGNARVTLKGGTIDGTTHVSGNATINNLSARLNGVVGGGTIRPRW